MNHPIHPEDVTFAGLVMGREAVQLATGCACKWHGEVYESRCELHEAWHVAIHEWADRAKAAEAAPAQAALAAPVTAPFAYFFRNVEKNLYEQVMPGAAGQPGIIAAYAAPVAAQPQEPVEEGILTSLGIALPSPPPRGNYTHSEEEIANIFYSPAVPVTDAGYFYNLVMHALMDVDAPHGGCKSRLKDIAEKLEVLMIASRGQA